MGKFANANIVLTTQRSYDPNDCDGNKTVGNDFLGGFHL